MRGSGPHKDDAVKPIFRRPAEVLTRLLGFRRGICSLSFPMCWLGVTALALVIGNGAPDVAEGRLVRPTAAVGHAPSVRVVAVAPLTLDVDDPRVAAHRLETALLDRIKPLEARFREDARLRRAGAVIGLGAVAFGALHGQQPLIAVGTGVLRVGLDRQLAAMQRTTGFSVSPGLERRGFSITLTRTFQ
jgi:hypothetical protein